MAALKTVTFRDTDYEIGKLSARKQWDVMRRISPLLQGLLPLVKTLTQTASAAPGGTDEPAGGDVADEGAAASAASPTLTASELSAALPNLDLLALGETCLPPLTHALAQLSDADSNYVIDACLAVVQRPNANGKLVTMTVNGQFRFQQDDDLALMLTLTGHVIWENLASFLGERPGTSVRVQGTSAP